MPDNSPPDEDWPHLERTINRRIAELPMTKTALQRTSRVSQRTFAKMADGVPLKSPQKRTSLARALGWTPSSIELVLHHEQPITVHHPVDDPAEALPLREAIADAMTERDRLVREVVEARQREDPELEAKLMEDLTVRNLRIAIIQQQVMRIIDPAGSAADGVKAAELAELAVPGSTATSTTTLDNLVDAVAKLDEEVRRLRGLVEAEGGLPAQVHAQGERLDQLAARASDMGAAIARLERRGGRGDAGSGDPSP